MAQALDRSNCGIARSRGKEAAGPEINGPAVQQEFTSLLRETCSPGAADQPSGAALSHEGRAVAGVSRGHSTESHEPGNTPESLTTWEGLNWAGRHDPRGLVPER